MTKTIQEQINPSFKANILANGMVLFTKEPDAAGTDGVVQWAIPPKSPDVVGYKPDTIVTGQPGATASLGSELGAKVKARRDVVDKSMGVSTEASAGESTEATTGAQPAGRPKGASTGAQPVEEPTGSKTQLKEASKGARTAVAPAGSGAALKEASKGARTAVAPAGSGAALRESTKPPAAARTAVGPAESGATLRESTKTPTVQRAPVPKKELEQQRTEEIVASSRATAGQAAPPMAEGSRRGGLRRSKRKVRS